MANVESFWIPRGGRRYMATEHVQGPWDPSMQHGGPPGALLVRELERCTGAGPSLLGRISIDILRPIPMGEVEVAARIVRAGRSVQLLEAELKVGDRVAMRASAWQLRIPDEPPPAPVPEAAPPFPAHSDDPSITPEWDCGFLRATEWRFTRGHYTRTGPATVWVRLRYPLVSGEEASPVQRLIAAADSVNGVSSALDIRTWLFIPPELTLHVVRAPVGEWICLDAATTIQPGGIGLATANLYDQMGLVGRSEQALYLTRRHTGSV